MKPKSNIIVHLGDAEGEYIWDGHKWVVDPNKKKSRNHNNMKIGQDKGLERRRKEFHQRIDKMNHEN